MCRIEYVKNMMDLSALPYGMLQIGKRENVRFSLNTHKLLMEHHMSTNLMLNTSTANEKQTVEYFSTNEFDYFETLLNE